MRTLGMMGLVVLMGCATPRPAGMVVVPSMTGTLPDGRPVSAIVVVPPENILEKNQEWLAWEKEYSARYGVKLERR